MDSAETKKLKKRLRDKLYNNSEAGKARLRRHKRTEKGKAADKRVKQRKRAQIIAMLDTLRQGPCHDCGKTYDPVCMEFHHTRDKLFSVASLRILTLAALKREVDKCVLLCALCHRLRHANDTRSPSGLAKKS